MLEVYQLDKWSISANIGLTADQVEYRDAALNFAKTELAPYMQTWDLTVS